MQFLNPELCIFNLFSLMNIKKIEMMFKVLSGFEAVKRFTEFLRVNTLVAH